jgi:signal transduction histidine kinase
MYVGMTDFNGVTLAHPAYPKMIGENMLEAKDAAGKPFIKEAIALCKTAGSGEIDMRWTHPQTKTLTDASGLFQACRRP